MALKVPAKSGEKIAQPGGEPVSDLHVTLFYSKGGNMRSRVRAAEVAHEVVTRHLPIRATLGPAQKFDPSQSSDGKHVVYAAVDAPAIFALRDELVESLEATGIVPDGEHGFNPHVTLAYVDEDPKLPKIVPIQVELSSCEVDVGHVAAEIDEAAADTLPEKDVLELTRVLAGSRRALAKKRVDVSKAQLIGYGSQGAAFDVGGGRVLKVTYDAKEANASARVMGMKLPNIVRVYDVFRFPVGDVYGILQERLSQMPAADKNEFVEFVTDVIVESGTFSQLWWIGDWDTIVETAIEGAKEDDDATPESVARIRRELSVLREKYQMDKIVAQLKRAQIKFRDFHGGNLMLRGSEHVLIDLGYSQAPKAQIRDLGEAPLFVKNGPPPLPVSQRKIARTPGGHVVGLNQDQAKAILKKNRKLLAKRGIDVPYFSVLTRVLGKGTRGIAFDVGNGRALKLTNDGAEAVAANKLKGQDFKHIFRVYDVFRFRPDENFSGHVYGILQERLKEMGSDEAQSFDDAVRTVDLPGNIYHAKGNWQVCRDMMQRDLEERIESQWPEYASDQGQATEAAAFARKVNDAYNLLTKKFSVPEMAGELASAGITFHDYHSGNIMKRGVDFVVIDIGYSRVRGGKEPPVLETRWIPSLEETIVSVLSVRLGEAPADRVAVTMGRYQPFHRGHADVIRGLARDHGKILVFVDVSPGPFSYEIRLSMMESSLPDIWSKIDVRRAEIDGLPSDDLPRLLSNVSANGGTPVRAGVALEAVLGSDRFDLAKRQFEKAAEEDPDGWYDPSQVVVRRIPGATDSGTARYTDRDVIVALKEDDRESFRQLVDPHLASDDENFEKVYASLRRELGVRDVREALNASGGEPGVKAALGANAQSLAKRQPYPVQVDRLQKLGNGQDGFAYRSGQQVLKVTTDRREAQSSMALKDKKLEHVVRIFDVFQLKTPAGVPQGSEFFGIVEETLSPLSPEEVNEFDSIDKYLTKDVMRLFPDADFPAIIDKISEEVSRRLTTVSATDTSATAAPALRTAPAKKVAREPSVQAKKQTVGAEQVTRETARVEQVLRRFQLDKMLQELRGADVKFYDFHSGNIMKRGSTYVVIDLGRSDSGGAQPPVIERVVEMVLAEIGVTMASGPGSSQTGLRGGTSGWAAGVILTPSGSVPSDEEDDGELEPHQLSHG